MGEEEISEQNKLQFEESVDPKVRSYDNKPVYVKSRELNRNNAYVVSGLPKKFRYAYSEILIVRAGSISSAIINTFKAYGNKKEQLKRAEKITEACDDYLTELRVMFDNAAVTRKAFSEQCNLCISIIKQAQAWIKYLNRTQENSQ